ncbi:Coenzyme F420 hydrogenase/dehydrogenase, beta subunit C-terminal domain [Klebsiella quasipneumoniae]|uniref:Coenzyme F420 hydrogenase/dehydrogenase, beta subunit C-terminal domain n=2 Tax=Klebsiella quasipneumoniae TaxID=1463165 RepID=UPI00388D8942|nr:Coenzyme F420 hydrogenase/dehydrogenase, beta subunit C-terminal domain [Klebsiella pneumoniae]
MMISYQELVRTFPCYIKTIRLLQREGKFSNIKFCISLLCGHMKSSGFGESMAWQVGINPKEQTTFDFRVKKPGFKASQYYFEAEGENSKVSSALNSSLLGADWGLGFFRHQSCNFCDDIAGELADVTLGDAWLDKYTKDYLGTNILVVRNEQIFDLLNNYKQEVKIEEVDVETFYNTQKSNYGNRRGGIIAQLSTNNKKWMPQKRLDICEPYKPSKSKSSIYLYRAKISSLSIKNFGIAKRINSLAAFKLLMFPYLIKYYYMHKGAFYAIRQLIPNQIKILAKGIKSKIK